MGFGAGAGLRGLGKLIGLGSGIRAGARGARGLPWRGIKGIPKAAWKLGKLGGRGAVGLGGYAVNHPYRATTIGSGLLGVGGLIQGGRAASRSLQPPRPAYRRSSPKYGPGYSTWASGGGARPSGNMALGLHSKRHG
jgi:hypothetical protein